MRAFKHRLLTDEEKSFRRYFQGVKWSKAVIERMRSKPTTALVINRIR